MNCACQHQPVRLCEKRRGRLTIAQSLRAGVLLDPHSDGILPANQKKPCAKQLMQEPRRNNVKNSISTTVPYRRRMRKRTKIVAGRSHQAWCSGKFISSILSMALTTKRPGTLRPCKSTSQNHYRPGILSTSASNSSARRSFRQWVGAGEAGVASIAWIA
jgi:hypothetical protein